MPKKVEQTDVDFDQKGFDKAIKDLVKEYKKSTTIKEDELHSTTNITFCN